MRQTGAMFCVRCRLHFVFLAAWLLLMLVVAACARPQPINSVAWLSQKYDMPGAEVEKLAALYGVRPDQLADYGLEPFPINWIVRQFEQIEARQGQVTKEDVQRIVRGQLTECDTDHIYYYFFYSADPTFIGRNRSEPTSLVLEVVYDITKQPRVMRLWTIGNIYDSGFNSDRYVLEKYCGIKENVVTK